MTGIPWTGIELFVAERSFAGVFPTHHGQACIWVCTPSADANVARRRTGSRVEAVGELLERCAPQLTERLRHARRTSPVQGMLRHPNLMRQAFRCHRDRSPLRKVEIRMPSGPQAASRSGPTARL